MTPEQAAIVRTGLSIASAYLRSDDAAQERLLDPFLTEDKFPRLVEHFVLVGILAADTIARGRERMPFDQALEEIAPRDEVVLLPGLPMGPWQEVKALASAYKHGGDDAAREVPLTMDRPSAVNVAFQFAVSALAALTEVPEFSHLSPADAANMFIEGIDAGHATR